MVEAGLRPHPREMVAGGVDGAGAGLVAAVARLAQGCVARGAVVPILQGLLLHEGGGEQ